MVSFPGFLINSRLKGGLERFMVIVSAEEIGVTDEDATLVCGGNNQKAADEVG